MPRSAPTATAPMRPSFAQFSFPRHATKVGGVALAFGLLGGCATTPPPTGELTAAQQAVSRADGADADQYAADAIAQARSELTQAQAALAGGEYAQARTFAASATADADFAHATSQATVSRQDFDQRRREVATLRQQVGADDGTALPRSAFEDMPAEPPVADAAMRLQALDADASLQGYAAYERLRARQALDAALAARSRERAAADYLAGRRVAIAELAARTEATRRAIDQLDRQRSDLLVEASRQEAERARQEAERLRVEAQIQAEEAQRLRAAAEAASAAQQDAENLVIDVGGAEADRLRAARARDAELARREAELMSGQAPSQPPAKPAPRKPAKKK